MKVLSLLQPWAGLLFTPVQGQEDKKKPRAAKQWETRSWQPAKAMLETIQREGLLIHASEGWKKDQQLLMGRFPFSSYISILYPMRKGVIIGRVTVGRILRTEDWLKEQGSFDEAGKWFTNNIDVSCEHKFGDYSPERYAWEFTGFEKFDEPIPAKGKLSLWDYAGPLPELKKSLLTQSPL